jgi:hypothetical protein
MYLLAPKFVRDYFTLGAWSEVVATALKSAACTYTWDYCDFACDGRKPIGID